MNEETQPDALSVFTEGVTLCGEETQGRSDVEILGRLYQINLIFDRMAVAHLGFDSATEALNPAIRSFGTSAVEHLETGPRLTAHGCVGNAVTGNAYAWSVCAQQVGGVWTLSAMPAVAGSLRNIPTAPLSPWVPDSE